MSSRLRLLLPTLMRLGGGSVASVVAYRLSCRLGRYRRLFPKLDWEAGGNFLLPGGLAPPAHSGAARDALLAQAGRALKGELTYYSSVVRVVGSPPDWFLDPFSGTRMGHDGHWSTCDEFSQCDVKNVWEASRFEWVPLLAMAWRLEQDERYLKTVNSWLLDWVEKNPANWGPNWKCGQEAGIRTINLLLGARLIGCHGDPPQSLVRLISLHCARILPTIRYAVAQNNNHGTSEAAALFIAGGWLAGVADTASLKEEGRHWHEAGRRWLENRVATLVASDGSFSQYSVNYHRVLLDTLSQVEFWRRELQYPQFSELYLSRCRAATQWLSVLTDPETGLAPNLGANDGARLYDLSLAPYRDSRPSVQLADALFNGRRAYGEGLHNAALEWLGITTDEAKSAPGHACHTVFGDGGYIVLRRGASRGVIRFASFSFRPGHADCLHLDLWHKGRNILRDGGTFSYNTEPRWLEYFSGTESHNTVQFDDRSQMPRIGRFLFGAWLKMEQYSAIGEAGETTSWSGVYTDWQGCRHKRCVTARENGTWQVRDEISGYSKKAILRWRLMPGDWALASNCCDSDIARMEFTASVPFRRLELVTGWESQHYQQKSELPVLEVEVGPGSCSIITEITLKD